MANTVFIATSLDGFIADRNNNIDWLHSIPNPENIDMGYHKLINRIDALVMGRNTVEKVMEITDEWPYSKPVFMLSHSQTELPDKLKGKVSLVDGNLQQLTEALKKDGYHHLYIDGGKTVQSFLREDAIDEMIITTIPIVLGGGIPLFGQLTEPLAFRCVESTRFSNGVCQNHFQRHID